MVTPTDIKYAQRLRGLRLSKDYKQELMADKLGFNSQQQYSKLENGQMNFSDEIIQKICKEFEISFDDFTMSGQFVNFSNSPNSNSYNSINNDLALIKELLDAKDEVIRSLKEQIEFLKK